MDSSAAVDLTPTRKTSRWRHSRWRYAGERFLQSVAVVSIAYTVTFFLLYALPGDAVVLRFSPDQISNVTPEQLNSLRALYGLDKPMWIQYVTHLFAALRGDLGTSIQTRLPVTATLLAALPYTLELAGLAMALAVIIAIALAVTCGTTRSPPVRRFVLALPSVAVAVPIYVVGLLLLHVFAFQLRLVPSYGARGFQSLILPAVTLGISVSAPLTHLLSRSVLDELAAPYATTATMKGATRFWVVTREVLKNASMPALTVAGVMVGNLIAGAVLVETVFAGNGFGRLVESAVRNRDIPVVLGVVVVASIAFVLVSLVTDFLHRMLDPRLGKEADLVRN